MSKTCIFDSTDPNVLNCDDEGKYNIKNISTNYGSYLFVPALNLDVPENCYYDSVNKVENCVQYLDETSRNLYPKLSPYYISKYSFPGPGNKYMVQDLPDLPSKYPISYYNPDEKTNADYPVCLINTDTTKSLIDVKPGSTAEAHCFSINIENTNGQGSIAAVYDPTKPKLRSMPKVND
jgi:hypothetical protein